MPHLLRTKPDPEVESRYQSHENRTKSLATDAITKQLTGKFYKMEIIKSGDFLDGKNSGIRILGFKMSVFTTFIKNSLILKFVE